MGEVYRAEDTSLKREVAIKVLPEQFTKDPQRLARVDPGTVSIHPHHHLCNPRPPRSAARLL